MAVAENQGFGIDDAWNAVALEERLDLISKAQASGVSAALVSTFIIGSIAYGFDQIWLLLASFGSWIFIMPMFTSRAWRKGKPALIIAYLAVRTLARRFAYGHGFPDIDIILIFRGHYYSIYNSQEDLEVAKQNSGEEEGDPTRPTDVWICLMRGGVVLLKERPGGAQLEFACPVIPEVTIRKPKDNEPGTENAVVIEGAGSAKGRIVCVDSKWLGALYVFDKQVARLVYEAQKSIEKLEKLRQSRL